MGMAKHCKSETSVLGDTQNLTAHRPEKPNVTSRLPLLWTRRLQDICSKLNYSVSSAGVGRTIPQPTYHHKEHASECYFHLKNTWTIFLWLLFPPL